MRVFENNDNEYIAIRRNKGEIETVRNGDYYVFSMGKLCPFQEDSSVIGITGLELETYLNNSLFKEVMYERDIVKYMLMLEIG